MSRQEKRSFEELAGSPEHVELTQVGEAPPEVADNGSVVEGLPNPLRSITDPVSAEPISTGLESTRVRFSLDASRVKPSTAQIDVQPAPPRNKQSILKQATSHFRSSSTDASTTDASAPAGAMRSSSRTRNRGYSLRRSLFAQNIQKGNGMVMEMKPSGEGSERPLTANDQKGDKNHIVTTVNEPSMEEEESLPTNPVRLSDPIYDLPSYRHWLSKQRTRRRPFKPAFQAYRRFKEGLFQPKKIPPSSDGRHVLVNSTRNRPNVDERTGQPYMNNFIRSCRYTPLNFVPRQLWAQFGKLANFYFLCISILQMIPGLSTTGTYTTIIPLLIFVCISMAKEGYDDLRRYRLDREENERLALVLDDQAIMQSSAKEGETTESAEDPEKGWRTKQWQEIAVGDVVLLHRDCPAPADLVILHSNDVDGNAYVETKSLDGETNLKLKKPLVGLAERCQDPQAIANLETVFVAEDPNADLYKFEGRIAIGDESLPLTTSEVIYRGSILRNTKVAIGICVYTGEECKIRMNANKIPRIKAPTLQARVNRVVIFVASLVFTLAIFLTVAYQIWSRDIESHSWYLQQAKVSFGPILTSFIIMFNTMLPLSLYVSLEIIKVCQMYLMDDIDLYDPETDTPLGRHTSTINEELGQVSYIFSDKTGTLTNNSMRFRKMSVAGTAWLHDRDLQDEAAQHNDKQRLLHKKRKQKGKGIPSRKSKAGSIVPVSPSASTAIAASGIGRASSGSAMLWTPSTNVHHSLQCGKTEQMLEYISQRPHTVFARKARFFILCLALCHTCMPEKDEDGDVNFQAASPDELALVMAAQDLGYVVVDRAANSITIKNYPNGDEETTPIYETYEVLDVIEFSSARKRMSIVVRLPDQRVCIFCKGADTTIRKLLRQSELASTHVRAVERRASQRKSLEAQEVLRRKSVQLGRKSGLSGRSMSFAAKSPTLGRNSSVSFGRLDTVRDSVDHWLRDRETDVDLSDPRKSSQYYSPRHSVQSGAGVSVNQLDGRTSFQTDEMEDLVDEALIINDHAVFERCFQHIDDFATEGLRTLLYAYRYLEPEEYRNWKEVYAAASTSLVDRTTKMEAAGELIETQLELAGATAIEDKLQKGVPDAIDRFRRAGIKMWMLTGDKRETAINIGHSCRLIKDYSTVVILDHELGDLHQRMANALADINSERTAHSVLVIDGQTLGLIDTDPASKALFTDLAILADSVICCRASPSQKATLVKTIRTKVKGSVTLAIGDGANDIAMIQEAHLGIGIAGKEGLQAARSSDYSIGQFRFLLKLLLVHGRWNYIRICKYTLSTFWKEMMFYLVQALYQRWNGYTGTSLYEPWSLSMFNTLFTSLPVIFMGVFEKDLAASTLLAVPELYNIGQRNEGFNFKIYLWWVFLATCEAVIVFFTMYSIYGEALFTRDQQLYAMGALAFTACVTIISLKIQVLELHNKSIAAAIAIFLSVGGWWLWNLLLSLIYPQNVVYNVNHGLLDRFGRNILWWLTLILIVLAVSLFEITVKSVKTAIWPTDVDIFQRYEQDLDVRKRFEEAAADLLQQGWDRGTKKSSLEIEREVVLQAEREAQVQELLNRPRTMSPNEKIPDVGVRRRRSDSSEHDNDAVAAVERADQIKPAPRRSVEIGDLFSQGFGRVKKGEHLK
jgi:phospholipid-translocating ATPase